MAVTEKAPREERRVITVLFADLVGFTERSEQLDPEDVRALLGVYYDELRSVLEAHGGAVDKFIGDAVMGVFGAPIAHEDDPERAVRAALAICDWARGRDDLSLRVGVNTGEALVALEPSASGMGIVAGDMVNTASRIQSAAPTEGVLVGEATYRATREVFDYRPHPAIEAKGKSEPVQAWEAVRARVEIGRGRRPGDAPLVGRELELGLLRAAYERARGEHVPQLVTLVGVPGIGKTRLVSELAARAADDPETTWLEGRSLPYGTGTSFWGLGEMVKAHAAILETDSASEAAAKLRRAVDELVQDPSDAPWLESHLRPLAGLAGEGALREERQAEAHAAWRRFFELLAAHGTLVLAFDDLHWADDAVLDLVDELVSRAVALPLLVVATARPELFERRADWGGGKANATTVSLSPLSDAQTMELVASLAGELALDAGVGAALLERAGGNPLYAEEFVRMAAEEERSPQGVLPESVHGIVAARLDLLSLEEKELVQSAAVVGHVFWSGAVSHALEEADRAVSDELLHELQHKEFVRASPATTVAGEAEFTFRHPLIREVAYEQMPRARRAGKHLRVAEWTEALPSDRAEDRAVMLAHHYLRALEYTRAAGRDPGDLPLRAARALREAGDHARALYSLEVATEHYRVALTLVEDGESRAELELELAEVELRAGEPEAARGRLARVVEAARTTGRADLLARAALARGGVAVRVGDADESLVALLEEALVALGERDLSLRARVLARLAVEVYYLPPTTRREELSTEAVRLARQVDAEDALADALNARHAALWSPDRLAERLPVARELVALAERIGDRERSLQARTWLVLDLVEAGEMDAARQAIDAFAGRAEALGIPAFLWWISAWRGMLALFEGRFDEARRLSEETRRVGARAGDVNAELYATSVAWFADLEQGRADESWLAMIEDGIARGNAAGAYRAGLALHYARQGRAAEAGAALAELDPDGLGGMSLDMNWLAGAAQLSEALGLVRDAARAEQAYGHLLPFADRNCLIARGAVSHGPAHAYLGRLAAVAGRFDDAERHFQAGIEAADRMGGRPIAIRTRAWYAEMLHERDRPGDRERAEELARDATDEASRLGLALESPAT